jgi:hypothetical protein
LLALAGFSFQFRGLLLETLKFLKLGFQRGGLFVEQLLSTIDWIVLVRAAAGHWLFDPACDDNESDETE